VGFDYFHNHFLTLSDLNTYNLQENIRLGPYFQISSDLASSHVLFSTHSFIRARMKYSFVQKLYKDSFISISMSSADRYDGQFSDDVYKFGANYSSHRLAGLGRLIMDLRLSTSYGNRDNNRFVLGSGSGVRGVESRFYSGEKGFRANFEFRSSPIELLMFNAGLVLFYDVGAAFDRFADANATHALGLGFRVLAPQVSSIPFRFDLAFPIYGVGRKYHAVVPSFGSGQAF
jgi:outer membrane protein assembly factor BamA